MKNGRITIKDIAERLGISPSTVSRALRDHPDISPETKKRVLSIADEYDYHPDSIAQSLKTMQTNTIGVIVPEIRHDFFSSALNGIEDVTYGAGYTIIVCKSNESYEREVMNTRALVSNRVAGLIASISQTTEKCDHFHSLKRRNVPIVFFDRVCEALEASKVVVDDREGAFEAVEYLINRGYKRIAHIAGPQHLPMCRDRYQGYCQAFKKHQRRIDENLILFGGLNEEDGINGFNKLKQLSQTPDAVFAVNDPVAIGVFMQMKSIKMKIPDDLALVGFSDNPIASLIDPPLTTVSQPAYEMGVVAAKLLLEEIQNKGAIIHQTKVLKTKLMIRNSV